jgi:hypothetical protein
MPGSIVVASNVLTAGLRADFWDTYERTYEGIKARLANVMQLDVPSDKLTEIYGYFQSAPYPRRWIRGEEMPNKAFKSVQFSVTNLDWAQRVSWHENDRQDDMTKSLRDRAQAAGEHFATLDERVFFQINNNSTDLDLLPSIPNAADGAALYSATDGDGSDRFGVSGGNIQSGAGVGSPVAIRSDFFKGIQKFRQFQDTEGQPLWDDSVIDSGYTVFFNVTNWQVFAEAFQQGRTVAATGASTAAVTNIIMDAGLRVELVPTQRITGNDWFVYLKGARKKAIFKQNRQPLREWFATMDNSDQARNTKIEYMQWEARYGYGILLPYQAVKIDN